MDNKHGFFARVSGRFIKSVRPTHGGLEYVIQTESSRYTITSADFSRIGEDVLCQGAVMDEETMYDLELSAEKLSCIQKALKHLEYSAMSEKKIRTKLHGKFSAEAIDAALDILIDNGYINDVRLATDLCEEYFSNYLMGPMKVKSKLYQKQFSRNVINEVFENFEFEDSMVWTNMETLIYRKFGEEIEKSDRGNAIDYLVRWGYSYDDARDFILKSEQW